MRMKKETLTVGQTTCVTYVDEKPQYLLIQPVDDHDLEVLDSEVEQISQGQDAPFVLAAFKIKDWNKELSPWEAPAAFGKENFGSGAGQTLDYVLHALLPAIRQKYDLEETLPLIIGGYSLAGLFSLWSAYQKELFSAVMAASPSVWFEGWTAYAKANVPMTENIYLSLGDREEKTRNQAMARVGDAIREQEVLLKEQQVNCTLEWNQGNHFMDADGRCAKGFIWCMKGR